jgi:chaperonin GroEL
MSEDVEKHEIYFEETLDNLSEGLEKLSKTVKSTLGPGGRNVMVERPMRDPQITNDGAYITREMEFHGEMEHSGSEAIRQAAIATAEHSGDGTTSTVLMGTEMFKGGRKVIANGVHPMLLKNGMMEAMNHALAFVQDYAFPVESPEEIAHVASVSAGGDDALGELIAEAIETVGKDGIIQVEEGSSTKTTLEFAEGVQLDRGYAARDFVTDQDSDEVRYEDAFVFLADKRLTSVQDVLRPMEYAHQNDKPLVVIAHDIEGDALATLVQNMGEGNLDCVGVKAPRVEQKRTEILDNLGVLTNAAVLSDQKGLDSSSSDPDVYIGELDSITVTKDRTTIVGGAGSKEDIQSKIQSLRTQLQQSGSEHDKEFYQQQVSQLSGGMAIIEVGGHTESELKEYKNTVEDALSATRAAVRTGIVPGGGVTYLEIADYLEHLLEESEVTFETDDERAGFQLFIDTMEIPFSQVLKNADYKPDVVMHQYREELDKSEYGGIVFDIRTGSFRNAYEAGILEPEMVIEDVLTNGTSTAASLLTSSCMVRNIDPDDE